MFLVSVVSYSFDTASVVGLVEAPEVQSSQYFILLHSQLFFFYNIYEDDICIVIRLNHDQNRLI